MQPNDNEQLNEETIKYAVAKKITPEKSVEQTVAVVNEVPLTIFVNQKEIVTLLYSGENPVALAVGFIRSEGLINNREDIIDISLNKSEEEIFLTLNKDPFLEKEAFKRQTITSGCGKGTMFYYAIDSLLNTKIESSLIITSDQVFSLMSQFNRESILYKYTRGVHNAALATPSRILFSRADIGRHNAVDMIGGECLLNDIPLSDKLLLTTGRITSELLLKAARMGIPFIISRNVATYHSITLAQKLGITLIGDVRGNKFFVYTYPGRVKL
jgi:FdhD protein